VLPVDTKYRVIAEKFHEADLLKNVVLQCEAITTASIILGI
jgi:hypothetical protein